MLAMVLESPRSHLVARQYPIPEPEPHEVLIKIQACAVCRTDLHIVDGELDKPKLPLVLGHEIVGIVEKTGISVTNFQPGQLVGLPWLGGTCASCHYCNSSRENLCDKAIYTGYLRDGGFAEYTTADARFVFPIPKQYKPAEAAPLLCAGLIGWRCLKFTEGGINLGLYGFGAAAHIIIQIAKFQKRKIFAFTKEGDKPGQQFARSLGATWAGGSNELPPEQLDATIIFAPVGALVPQALKATRKGGFVVCGGIHMSDIPSFSYNLLWGERSIKSVANLTRVDALEFLQLAPQVPVKTTVKTYPLLKANDALADLRQGQINGAAVLVP